MVSHSRFRECTNIFRRLTRAAALCAGLVEENGEHRRPARHPHALLHHRTVLLRRLQARHAAGQPPPGEMTRAGGSIWSGGGGEREGGGCGIKTLDVQLSPRVCLAGASLRGLCGLFQAQRDYFGAHTYELLSNPGHFIHTNWTGHGGNVSSSSYNA